MGQARGYAQEDGGAGCGVQEGAMISFPDSRPADLSAYLQRPSPPFPLSRFPTRGRISR